MLKPGENIDSWCGPCKMVLAHTIEAMVGEKPARVHCNTCKAQHSYKPNKPVSKVKDASATPGVARVRVTKPRASQYQTLLKGNDVALAKPYSINSQFAAGDVLQHPSFGVGVTTALREGAKIEVMFEGGLKILVHGR